MKNSKRIIALTLMAAVITTGLGTQTAGASFIDWSKSTEKQVDPELRINTNLNTIDPTWGEMNENGDIIVDWYKLTHGVSQPEVDNKFYQLEEEVVVKEKEVVQPTYVAVNEDFKFIELGEWDPRFELAYEGPNGELGIFVYEGEIKEVIELPSIINEVEITSYAGMFMNSKMEKLKVIANNEKLVSTQSMFAGSEIEKINLSEFNAPNVENMSSMFANAKGKSLNLTSLETGNVITMKEMFASSTYSEIEFGNWDMKNIKSVAGMFKNTVNLYNLDLSKVGEISKDANFENIFHNVQTKEVRNVTAKRKNVTQFIKYNTLKNDEIYFYNK